MAYSEEEVKKRWAELLDHHVMMQMATAKPIPYAPYYKEWEKYIPPNPVPDMRLEQIICEKSDYGNELGIMVVFRDRRTGAEWRQAIRVTRQAMGFRGIAQALINLADSLDRAARKQDQENDEQYAHKKAEMKRRAA